MLNAAFSLPPPPIINCRATQSKHWILHKITGIQELNRKVLLVGGVGLTRTFSFEGNWWCLILPCVCNQEDCVCVIQRRAGNKEFLFVSDPCGTWSLWEGSCGLCCFPFHWGGGGRFRSHRCPRGRARRRAACYASGWPHARGGSCCPSSVLGLRAGSVPGAVCAPLITITPNSDPRLSSERLFPVWALEEGDAGSPPQAGITSVAVLGARSHAPEPCDALQPGGKRHSVLPALQPSPQGALHLAKDEEGSLCFIYLFWHKYVVQCLCSCRRRAEGSPLCVCVPAAWEVLLEEGTGCSCHGIHGEKRNYVLQPVWLTEFLVLMFAVGVKDV